MENATWRLPAIYVSAQDVAFSIYGFVKYGEELVSEVELINQTNAAVIYGTYLKKQEVKLFLCYVISEKPSTLKFYLQSLNIKVKEDYKTANSAYEEYLSTLLDCIVTCHSDYYYYYYYL
jgi:hypothetical protein